MRVLVIAGTGFIGQFVSRGLVDEGHEVTVMHRGKHDLDKRVPGAVSLINSEPLSSMSALREGLAAGPDRVVHMLAMTEADARSAREVFAGKIERLVFASSGDVYLAYGRFIGSEPGPIEPMPLFADSSPLRSKFYPYRTIQTPSESLAYGYEKILVERLLMGAPDLNSVCLRLPKVYGAENNRFETVYRFAKYPHWRWTHGYVENVAAAITLALLHPSAGGRIYNVGELETPAVADRVARLPPSTSGAVLDETHEFGQDIVFDTRPIRQELGYREPVSWEESVRRTLGQARAG